MVHEPFVLTIGEHQVAAFPGVFQTRPEVGEESAPAAGNV